MQPEQKEKKGCLGGCLRILGNGIGVLFILLVIVMGVYIVLRGAGAYLIYSDEIEPADIIVVLSGETESRMTEALNLYNERYGKVIVLTETGEAG